jgi:predicted GIY-YIG superfamily endonuclease
MISGIYLLRFNSDLVYIGQSKDIHRRFTTHCNKLTKGTHVNSKMLIAYTHYGLPKLEILLECPSRELDINEKEAIEIYDSINNGLNIAPAAGDFPVLLGETNGFSKYKDADIMLAIEYLANNLDQPLKISAKKLNIDYSTIKNIANGTTHKWLADKISDTYTKVINYKGKRIINTSANKGIKYITVSPNGEHYHVDSITGFARQHDLNAGALGEVLRGKTRQHKGWTSHTTTINHN